MFTINLPVKPYVKTFISLNYGDPADFSSNKYVNNQFRSYLHKPSHRRSTQFKELSLNYYSSTVSVKITDDDFYRYGWELTNTDIVSFGRIMEHNAKSLMRSMVAMYSCFMLERDAILLFQKKNNYTEDSWCFDSIKKDFYRSFRNQHKINFMHQLTFNLENIIVGNLSNKGTICPNLILQYENNHKAI